MVIEIEGCEFRVSGNGTDWQVEYPNKGQKSGYKGRYFYPCAEHAIGKAYELMLMEADKTVDIRDFPAECRKAKAALLAAVRKAAS